MKFYKNFTIKSSHKNSIILIGNFDGLHLGHQKLFNIAKNFKKKTKLKIGVITFDPNPYYILRDEGSPINIQNTESKLNMLKEMGIDKVLVIPFTKEFSEVTAIDFANNIIKDIWILTNMF